jgi:hypothetical protein
MTVSPVITWATPAPVNLNAILSGTQLNATANYPGSTGAAVAGAFVYSPALDAVMSTPGNITLGTTFTPTDGATYSTETKAVILYVRNAMESAVYEVSNIMAGILTIRQAPNYPNETQNVDPFAVTFFLDGQINAGPVGTKRNLINIRVDVLIPKVDLARDMAKLTPLVDVVSLALVGQVSGLGQRFNNTISTFDTLRITYQPDIDYAGVPMRGYSFVMENTKLLVSL